MGFKLDSKIDMKNLNRMVKDLNRLETTEVSIHYDEEKHGDDDFTNSELGLWMESGTRSPDGGMHILPRPALFRGAVLLTEDIDKPAAKVVVDTLSGNVGLINKSLQEIGEMGVASVQEAVDRGGFKKLSPVTVKLKRNRGSMFAEDALLETGKLYQSLMYTLK